MKKFISLIITLALFYSFTLNAFASSLTVSNPNSSVVNFDDGSYIVISAVDSSTNVRASTITGSKTAEYYSSDDRLLWSATLRGTFSYTGSSATCTSSSITYSVYDSDWRVTSATASKTGNKATGNAIAKRYILGIPTKTVEMAITITCSASGVLS